MEVLDDFIQILFDIIDKLFWFNPEIGPRKLKKNTELSNTISEMKNTLEE